jgi:lipopolysaccharide transport system permease protein
VRYKQTAIGVVWALLQPVLTTAIFTVIFSTLTRFESQRVPYPLFALSGFLVWLFIFNSISFAANSLVGNSNLVTKIYFPRLIVPISATLSGLFDLLFSFIVLAALMIYYVSKSAVALSWQIALVPVFILLAVLLAVSLGNLFSALNVRFRDVKFALPFALQVWMFASPIFYPPEILSEKVRFVLAFNP